ncbi:glucosaminidase domain-containing protein [Aliiglaciecola litoralis]|uniref:Glucosaminidase domain-containing protein n=1 Tax=Aliiglaciecola litoralis TaxID=582857 RepID=A0ABN1LBZ8_9ALTE
MKVHLKPNHSVYSIEIPSIKRITYLALIWIFGVVAFAYPFLFPPSEEIEIDEFAVYEFVEPEMPDFKAITDIKARKKAFFDYLLPAVAYQNRIIYEKRRFLMGLQDKLKQQQRFDAQELQTLETLVKDYRVEPDGDFAATLSILLKRIDVIPAELVLMQAANESAWGTSRFAREGYNFFGLWCFRRGCGFVPRQRNDGAAHEVAKFKNLRHAVRTYFRNINRHYAYKDLRNIRLSLRENDRRISAVELAKGLGRYSERGDEYIKELIQMIRYNRKLMTL